MKLTELDPRHWESGDRIAVIETPKHSRVKIDYDPERVVEAFHRRHGRGVSYSIVVVAEGAKPKGGGLSVVTAGDITKQEKLGVIRQGRSSGEPSSAML